MISLGCPKNLVDSEMILGAAGEEGLSVTASAEDADVIVVNTCGFIDAAKEESINTILEACELKRNSTTPKKVIVAGCLAQRYGHELRQEVPEVDAILGLGEYDDVGSVLRDLAAAKQAKQVFRLGDPDKACNAEVGRFRLTPSHYGYVKISEGCDNPCTFCAIPSMRGKFRSKPISMVVQEANELVKDGAKEIVLISQDTTSYGMDFSGRFELPRLLQALDGVDGLEWIRILYAYPAFLTDEMLDAIATLERVVNYIDVPLQHISDGALRRMGRRMNEKKTRDLLNNARRRIPGLHLRTTFIVGFPGEDQREFEVLRDFINEFEFERLGVFPYSREEGTPSADFDHQVPEDVRDQRLEELMLLQQQIAFRHNQARVGQTTKVLVDSVEQDEEGLTRICARSYGEAPEIDPSILVETATTGEQRPIGHRPAFSEVAVGDFLDVKITGSRDYDLIATGLTEGNPGS
jgi:ribosomal protein S12 methylthiotransferase